MRKMYTSHLQMVHLNPDTDVSYEHTYVFYCIASYLSRENNVFLCAADAKPERTSLSADGVKVTKSLMSEGFRELKWTCPLCSIDEENGYICSKVIPRFLYYGSYKREEDRAMIAGKSYSLNRLNMSVKSCLTEKLRVPFRMDF